MSVSDRITDMGYEDVIIFKNPDYEEAFMGVTTDCRAVYNYEKMVESLINEGMTEEDAIEWIDYNVIGGIIKDGPIVYYGE